jgi:hypothetical protein
MALTPEQEILGVTPEVSDLSRQKKIAELLMSQGLDQPQGQMISGYYVAPSWSQQLNPLFKSIVGTESAKSADKKELELAAALRGQKGEALAKFQQLMANPETRAQGMQFAAGNQFLQPLVADLMKPQKLGEGENLVMPSLGGGDPISLAKGAEKYRAPTSVDMGTMGTMLIYPDGRRETIQKGREGPAGQVVETENGPMLVNTRTGQAQPIMAGGQAIAGGKPLTESQGNATAFGMRAKEANKIVSALEDAGTTNTGIIRSAIGGTVGMAPFVGGKMEQGVQSAMNALPTYAGGPNQMQQQTDQGRRNFISAVLRKESGAAIPPDEYANEEKKYFPQVGDGSKVIEQKRKARELAIQALEIQAGPGAKQIRALGGNTDTGVVDFNSLPKRN